MRNVEEHLWHPANDEEARVSKEGTALEQYEMGLSYYEGSGVQKNDTAALYWFEKAANQGHLPAYYQIGVMYDKGEGVQQDAIAARGRYYIAAKAGYALAQYMLGTKYTEGVDIQQDDRHAFTWFKRAERQNLLEAQLALAQIYEHGNSFVQVDISEAIRLYRAAAQQVSEVADIALERLINSQAEQGTAEEQLNRARYYEAVSDRVKTAYWYKKSADQGNTLAKYKLALIYLNGWGVDKDIKSAVSLLKDIARQGHDAAQVILGDTYENGVQGVGKDMIKAVEFYRQAALQGNGEAATRLKMISGSFKSIPKNDEDFTIALTSLLGAGRPVDGLIHANPALSFKILMEDKLLSNEECKKHLQMIDVRKLSPTDFKVNLAINAYKKLDQFTSDASDQFHDQAKKINILLIKILSETKETDLNYLKAQDALFRMLVESKYLGSEELKAYMKKVDVLVLDPNEFNQDFALKAYGLLSQYHNEAAEIAPFLSKIIKGFVEKDPNNIDLRIVLGHLEYLTENTLGYLEHIDKVIEDEIKSRSDGYGPEKTIMAEAANVRKKEARKEVHMLLDSKKQLSDKENDRVFTYLHDLIKNDPALLREFFKKTPNNIIFESIRSRLEVSSKAEALELAAHLFHHQKDSPNPLSVEHYKTFARMAKDSLISINRNSPADLRAMKAHVMKELKSSKDSGALDILKSIKSPSKTKQADQAVAKRL